tara:strand:+ start:25102 stop:25824 length:723 start_codon:yes stop_codon:yes gene_type:complete
LIRAALLLLSLMTAPLMAGQRADQTVIVLHGLARSSGSMEAMAEALRSDGYSVVNLDYPSTRATVESLSESHLAPAIAGAISNGAQQVHFVTHSMGGILVRHYLATHETPQIGRVVMLGPPNHGSELVDRLHHLWPYQWINGPAGFQLGTDASSLPNQLGKIRVATAVIAGTRSYNPIYSSMIKGDDDGKVSVESTRLEGMSDHLILPVNHSFMMNDDEVIRQTLRFLRAGKFERDVATP